MTIIRNQKKKADVKGKPAAKKKPGLKSASKNEKHKVDPEKDFLKRIFSSLPSLVGYVDEDEIIRQANPRHGETFGVSPDKIIGQTFNEIFGTQSHDALKPYFREVLSGKPCHFETGIQGHKKLKGTFDVMLVPDANPNIDKNGFIYVIRDITREKQTGIALKLVRSELTRDVDIKTLELRETNKELTEKIKALNQAQNDLQESEDFLRGIMDNAADGIVTIDETGIILSFNAIAENIFGFQATEIIGKNVKELVPEPDKSRHDKYISDYIKTGKAKILGIGPREVTGLRKDGTTFPMDLATSEMFIGGKLIFIGIVRDVSKKKQAQENHEWVRNSLNNAQRIARLGSWNWNIATGELWWSEESFRIYGKKYTENSVSYEDFIGSVHPDDREKVQNEVNESLAGTPYENDHRVIHPNGETIIVHAKGEVTFDEDGTPLRMDGTVQDVTDRREAETALLTAKEQAEMASRTQTEFLANISHELRTPLNAIIGFSEMMISEFLGPMGIPQYREYVKNIHSSAELLLQIINDVLDAAQAGSGTIELREEEFKVSTAIKSCNRMMAERIKSANLSFTSNIEDGLPYLRADPRLVKQILLNLISNAVKFTPAGGKIEIRAAIDDRGGIRIEVADTGIGISAKDIPKAMAPFGQVDSALNRKYEGTGLGLPIVKSFIELHGGRFEISSTPGKGTVAKVIFPADRMSAPC